METDLRLSPPLRQVVEDWYEEHLPSWADALYHDEYDIMDSIEDSLVNLATRVEERARQVAQEYRKCGTALFPEPFEPHVDEHVEDINLCLKNLESLRPPGESCPVRTLMNRAIDVLETVGALRPGLWE